MLDDLTELPEGWEICTFGDLFDIKGGNQPPKSEFIDSLQPGYIRLLQIRDFESDKLAVYIKDDERLPKCSIQDLLIARYGASLGRICTGKSGSYNVALTKVIFDHDSLDRDWVKLFLESDWFQAPLFLVSRSAQNGFNKDELFPRSVPLPPLNEQKRIVSKIEELRSHTQAARNTIAHIPKLLEQFRQSVLAAAFRGDLTAEWRSENPDVEPAEVLLERIRKESEQASKKSAKRPEIIEPDFLDIPESWEIILSNDIFSFVTSGSRGWAQYYSDTGAIFVRVGNLNRDTISLDFKDIQFVNPPEGTEGIRTKIQPGDILVSITADVGMIGLVPEGISEAYINQHVSLARPLKNLYHDYFAWYLASFHDGYKQFQLLQRGATKAGLGLDDIRSIWIPLPPLNEQKMIVSHIEESLIAIDRIEQQYQFTKTELDRLDRSILAKAFKGELVPQDPTDEPAIVLLERIRNDRASQTKPAKSKRTKNRE